MPSRSSIRKTLTAVFWAASVLLVVRCSSPNKAANTSQTQAASSSSTPTPVIKLVVNPWLGAELNAEVAKTILEKEMGYSVELVQYDGGAQWEALAKGDADATLEVWPS